MRKLWVSIGIVISIVLDQISKWLVKTNMSLGETKTGISGLFSLTYLRNYGAAFSILQHQQWLFSVITVIIVGFALVYLFKQINTSLWMITSLVLIIAGGFGNFIDRVSQGYVVDFVDLDFINFYIFNLADSYLTVGVLLLLVVLWREEQHGNNN